jgi:hypothetical protein
MPRLMGVVVELTEQARMPSQQTISPYHHPPSSRSPLYSNSLQVADRGSSAVEDEAREMAARRGRVRARQRRRAILHSQRGPSQLLAFQSEFARLRVQRVPTLLFGTDGLIRHDRCH